MARVSWENVLVLQTSFLGDTVLTLPLIAEISRRFPVKKLTLLCLPMAGELLQDHPAINEIIVYDKKSDDRGWSGLRRKSAGLRAKSFTIALTPHKSLRSAMLLRLAEIPYRVGFRQSGGWFFFHARADRDPRRHDVERNLAVLEPFGVKIDDCRRELDLPVSPAMQTAVDQKLAELGAVDDKPIIGINAGSVWPTKRWWPTGFAMLIQFLKQRLDCQVLLFGGAEDAAVSGEVEKQSQVPVINLAGKINLRELPAAIGRCRVFVTNDSGPMHVAVARRVPTVALFCATTPDLGFYPYTENAVVLERALICRPCASHGGRRCPLGSEDCIRQIPSEKVFAAVERMLFSGQSQTLGSGRPYRPEFVTV
jgi:lipopolysaccharide heptosyltransferase II